MTRALRRWWYRGKRDRRNIRNLPSMPRDVRLSCKHLFGVSLFGEDDGTRIMMEWEATRHHNFAVLIKPEEFFERRCE